MSKLKSETLKLSDRTLTVTEATLRMDMERVRRLVENWEPETDPNLKTFQYGYAHLAAVTTPCPTFDEYLDMSLDDAQKWFDAVSRQNPSFFPGSNPTPGAEKPPQQP
jgi:hypothetical protein